MTCAEAAAATEEARIRADTLDGPDGRARRLTITECIATYLQRPGGIPHNDKAKVADLAERIGTCAVAFVDIDLHLPGIDRL